MTKSKLSGQERQQFGACFFTFMVNGAVALSIGALLPFVRESYGLGYAFAGLLVSLHSVGNLLAGFLAGVLPLYLGRRKSILLFAAMGPLGYVLISMGSAPWVLIAAFLMTGLARGSVSNFNNTVINAIAPGKAWALNTLHAMFAIGAFAAPIITLLCTASSVEGWRIVCYILLGAGLLNLIIYACMPLAESKAEKSTQKGGGAGFLREKQFLICTITLFFYLCAEQGVIGWMVTYFKDSGLMSASYAQMMASVLWVLILAGRLSSAALSQKMEKARLLCVMGVGFVAFFVLVLFGRTLPVITLGIAGFGFSMAGIYPTTVSFSGDVIKRYPLAWSTMLTTASLGSILMPSLIGAVAQHAGIYAGMCTIVAAVTLTAVCLFVNARMNRGAVK